MTAYNHNSRTTSKVQHVAPSPAYLEHCFDKKITILKTPASGHVYKDILNVRADVNKMSPGEAWDSIDQFADLYCVYHDGQAVGTMRVVSASRTKLDCEEFYPQVLLHKYRDRMGTACAFAVRQEIDPKLKIAKVLLEALWIRSTQDGLRLFVINAHERGVAYYQRMGYQLVEGSYFVHPKLYTPSYVLVMACDPMGASAYSHCFEHIANPISESEVGKIVSLSKRRPKRNRTIDSRLARLETNSLNNASQQRV